VDEDAFLQMVTERLAGLPSVEAVALGGSRALGASRPDSDWDFALYYRGSFDPGDLRRLGWPGHVSELGGWGGGVFNGGAWLTIEGRHSDVHYRDMDVVDDQLLDAEAGRFQVEPLLFHLAGIPTYLVVAELAVNRVLSGRLPRPSYPPALRVSAHRHWAERAELTLGYAEANYASRGLPAQCCALVAQAATHTAHAVLAGRGEWVTNEKTILARSGLDAVNQLVAGADSDNLIQTTRQARELCRSAITASRPECR
jgi:hypothetical protein